MYLVLESNDPLPYLMNNVYPDGYFDFGYALPVDGVALLRSWHSLGYSVDSHISGIFADYLEENRSEILEGATGPSDPAVRLDALIQYLRDRFHALPVA